MRAFRLALVSLLLATSLAAQTPGTRSANLPTRRSASFDLAALVDDRLRVALEPVLFGRWSASLVGSHTNSRTAGDVYYGVRALEGGIALPQCLDCNVYHPYRPPQYSAWSLDVAFRYYPAQLSFSEPRQRLMVYVGEFIGYHRRTWEEVFDIVPLRELPPRGSFDHAPPDIYPPYPRLVPSRIRHRLSGFEPGLEAGVRLIPLPPAFLDVGGWFKFVTIEDPMQRFRPGDVDARLVLAFGVGW